jgi:single-stranded DNA-binding protein ssbB
MLNQVVLVGRLVKDIDILNTKEGKAFSNIVLAIPRSFKNSEGEYETDFVRCTLWDKLATNAKEFCGKGQILGIKGKLQTNKVDDKYYIEVIAEKVSYLSSKKQ